MHMYCSHLKIFCRLSHISAVLQAGAVTLGVGSSGSGNGPQLSLSGGYASTGAGGSVLLRTGGSATAATGDLDMFTASSTSGKYMTVTSTSSFFHRFTNFRYTAGSGYVLVGSGSGLSSTGQVAISSGAASGGIAGAGGCVASFKNVGHVV